MISDQVQSKTEYLNGKDQKIYQFVEVIFSPPCVIMNDPSKENPQQFRIPVDTFVEDYIEYIGYTPTTEEQKE